jgi:SpoVK/Ycf46/Vps4 family AAA+-type ATPase
VGDNDSVIQALSAALEASPDDQALRRHLARVLLDSGRAGDSRSHIERLLRDAPDDAEVRALAKEAGVEVESAQQARKPVRLFAVRKSQAGPDEEVERPTIGLDDVAGMAGVKRRLRTAFLAPLENPALRRMYGKSLRGGLLLYGPPGCGKTFIARATAGELGARFIGVGLHEILDMYLGESERRLHEVFEHARREAPCVLFFDEVDALGRRRTQLTHSAGRDVIVQFLAELDSFGSENEGVFVLGATNHPWDVDPALRRPGRFDRTVLVLPPDAEARRKVLELNLRDRPTEEVDLEPLVAGTEMFSGADLAHVCETAAEFAIEDSIETGVARPIRTEDLVRASGEIRASTTAWLHTARNFAEFANEGGMYDELLRYLREHRIG